ncbi:MAG: HIT domain-containing protein [Polyangiaceae bacterium]|nr:HIT domain-containing protein [Polyangiaceae bacterium]
MVSRAPTRCVFCEIVAGRAPSHRVLEDETCVAFLDTRPLFFGHTLIVPRVHRATLGDLAAGELAALFDHARRVVRAQEEALGAEGAFVALNDRVSQSVPHVHVHVVPRRKKDGLRGFFWPRHTYPSDDAAAEIAAKLRSALPPRSCQ